MHAVLYSCPFHVKPWASIFLQKNTSENDILSGGSKSRIIFSGTHKPRKLSGGNDVIFTGPKFRVF